MHVFPFVTVKAGAAEYCGHGVFCRNFIPMGAWQSMFIHIAIQTGYLKGFVTEADVFPWVNDV